MTGDADHKSAPRCATITIVDKGVPQFVINVDRWVQERKNLLRKGRDIIKGYDGNPSSLYSQHDDLVAIATRLSELKVIFDTYNRERNRRIDANITAIVAHLIDPKTMEGIDD